MAKSTPSAPKSIRPSAANEPSAAEIAADLDPVDLAKLKEVLRIAEQTEAAAAIAGTGELVRVYHLNRSKGSFMHGEHRLDPGGVADVPQSVADLWTSHKDAGGAALCALSEAAVQKPDPAAVREAAKLKADLANAAGENDELSQRVKALEAQLKAAQAAAGPKSGDLPPLNPTPPVSE